MKILVIDNSDTSRQSIVEILYRIQTVTGIMEARSQEEAFKKINNYRPNIIILNEDDLVVENGGFFEQVKTRIPESVLIALFTDELKYNDAHFVLDKNRELDQLPALINGLPQQAARIN